LTSNLLLATEKKNNTVGKNDKSNNIHNNNKTGKDGERTTTTAAATTTTATTTTMTKPFVTSTSINNNSNHKKSAKRLRKEAEEDMEEQQLTALLFGTTTNKNDDTVVDDDDDDDANNEGDDGKDDEDDTEREFTFEIDRSGPTANEVGNNTPKKERVQQSVMGNHIVKKQLVTDHDNSDDDEKHRKNRKHNSNAEMTPAWDDPDDTNEAMKLMDGSNRLKKLRRTRQETEALTTEELELRLRQRYEQSTQITARTDWAQTTTTTTNKKVKATSNKEQNDDDDDDNDDDDDDDDDVDDEMLASKLFSTSQSLLATSYGNTQRLPPNILDVTRCPDMNLSDPNKAVCRVVHFHPGSDPDRPLALTAGLDKTLRFFQVGEESSEKIHGIHCK
jgi:hypothetical protein